MVPIWQNSCFPKDTKFTVYTGPEAVHLIFLSDDTEFVEYCFNNIKNKVILNVEIAVGFVVMVLCRSGIVSNSSFSW